MAAVAVGATALRACNGDAGTSLWLRELDPVVLTGADLEYMTKLRNGSGTTGP